MSGNIFLKTDIENKQNPKKIITSILIKLIN